MNKAKVLGLNLFTSLYLFDISTDTGCKHKLLKLFPINHEGLTHNTAIILALFSIAKNGKSALNTNCNALIIKDTLTVHVPKVN